MASSSGADVPEAVLRICDAVESVWNEELLASVNCEAYE